MVGFYFLFGRGWLNVIIIIVNAFRAQMYIAVAICMNAQILNVLIDIIQANDNKG